MKGIAQRYKIIPSDVGPPTSRPQSHALGFSCYERLSPVINGRVTLAHTAMRRKLLPGASADGMRARLDSWTLRSAYVSKQQLDLTGHASLVMSLAKATGEAVCWGGGWQTRRPLFRGAFG
jgi:hypothetical protein